MQVVLGILTLLFLVRFTMIKTLETHNKLKTTIYILLYICATILAIPFIDEIISPQYANNYYDLIFGSDWKGLFARPFSVWPMLDPALRHRRYKMIQMHK